MQRRGTKSEKNGDSSREGNHIVGGDCHTCQYDL